MQPDSDRRMLDRSGEWAEQVAGWYFRLNGFLSIPGFIVHSDEVRRHPRTEADLLGVRSPHSSETIMDRSMEDEAWIRGCAKVLFIITEVKTDVCNVNGPWSRPEEENMQRAIRRLGFAADLLVASIAQKMYEDLRWEDSTDVLQYVAVGRRFNHDLEHKFPQLKQITWEQISDFLFKRFTDLPQKLRYGRRVHDQWPDFGKKYGLWFQEMRHRERSIDAMQRYIEEGECTP